MRTFLAALFMLCSLYIPANSTPRAHAQGAADAGNFLSVALPSTSEVSVENRRGGVRVEVWEEPFVGVAYAGGGAMQKGSKARRASPVRIDRTEGLLSISVPRPVAGARPSPVELTIRLPRAARAKISTSNGTIEMSGVPASLSAQTVSGDIRLSIPRDADADITAHSLNGTALFESSGDAPPQSRQFDRAKFQTRLGAGQTVVRLFSGRGTIRVVVSPAAQGVTAPSERVNEATRGREVARGEKVPAVESESRPAAGVPDTHPKDKPQEVDEDEVVRVDTELVTVNFSVVDRAKGRGVVGLTKEDFRLYEDEVEQQIEHFDTASAPFDLVLLIDLSGSTGRVTDLIRAAALRFIEASRPQDRIAVITFASETRVVSPLTTDRAALRSAVRSMQPPQGHTRLYDATSVALEYLGQQPDPKRRRAVILMSDGLDSTLPNVTGVGSNLSFDELRGRVQEFEGLFYSIWTSTEYDAFSPEDIQPETFDLASERMEQLADTGGGAFYDVEKLDDLAGAYERVVEDLGTVYTLSYRPANRARDGRWRAIRVRLPAHPQAVARGKRGYYAN